LSGGRYEVVEASDEIAYRADMAASVERLVEQALKLPSESRARLADLLVESLDADALGRIDQLWVAEAKRRRDEVRSGGVKTVSGDEARRRVRGLVKQ
jgi:putative addiction module component (TIGR02574 family)